MATEGLEELDFGELTMLDVLGTQVELFRTGSGDPLLFLHGIDGIEGSAEFLRALSRKFTVFAPSHPGFGLSERPDSLNRVDDLGYFCLDLLDVLGLDRPVVAGSGFGAWVAAETLTKDGDRAAAAVLVSPLGLTGAKRREALVADIFMMSKQELGARLQLGAPPAGTDFPSLARMPEARLRRIMRNDEATSLYGWTPYMSNPKLAARLHRIASPTLVIWGADDAIVSESYRDTYAAALPQADVETFESAGHRVHADQPDRLAARIVAFADRQHAYGETA